MSLDEIPVDERVQATTSLPWRGRFIAEGAVLRRSDPAVDAHPDCFANPARPLP